MQHYIPQRSDIIWLDFEPVKGKKLANIVLLLYLVVKPIIKKQAF